jgi:hypothetical protein
METSMPHIDPALHYALAVAAIVYVLFRIGREPFVILGRRLTGSLPLRPLGSEPGAERWLAIGGAVTFAGIGVAALVSRRVGYPIAAGGLLVVAYAGLQVALDRDGAAETFVRRMWTDFGLTPPGALLQARVTGAAMAFIGCAGAAIVLDAAFA